MDGHLEVIKRKAEMDVERIKKKAEEDIERIKKRAYEDKNVESVESKKAVQSVVARNDDKSENRKGAVVVKRVGSEADALQVKLARLNPENQVVVGNFVSQVVRARESGRISETEERTLLTKLGEKLIKSGVRPDMVSEYVMESLEKSGERISPQSEERVEKTMSAFEDRVMRLMKEERERGRGPVMR